MTGIILLLLLFNCADIEAIRTIVKTDKIKLNRKYFSSLLKGFYSIKSYPQEQYNYFYVDFYLFPKMLNNSAWIYGVHMSSMDKNENKILK